MQIFAVSISHQSKNCSNKKNNPDKIRGINTDNSLLSKVESENTCSSYKNDII